MESLRTKDISIVFSKNLTSYSERPAENARYLVRKNLKSLVENTCRDASEFSHSVQAKLKALTQLKHLIVLAEIDIQKHIDCILRCIIRLYRKEDKLIDQQITIICELLGIYSDVGFYFPIIIKVLSEEEVKTSTRLVSNLLELSSYFLSHETIDTIQLESDLIIRIISDVENNYNENAEIMVAGFYLVANFISVAKELCSKYKSYLFSYLLTLQSIQNLSPEMNNKIENYLYLLAQHSGYKDTKELYSTEVSSVLVNFYESKLYKTWDKNSKDRLKFNILVRNCGRGLSDFLPIIIEILESLVAQEADLETRFDALSLIEFLINLDEMVEQMRANSLKIISRILIPAAVWRAGGPLIKIRKAGIICMINLLQKQLISEENLQNCISELKPVLKTCLNDDRAPDLRFSSCVLLDLIFSQLRETLTDIDLSDLYPQLLERLDDSQDMIRIEITKSINKFFWCSNLKMSPGTFEYVVKNLLIHLDDQNEQLQKAIFQVLQSAASIKPKLVFKEAKIALPKQRYPHLCSELIRSIEENFENQLQKPEDSDGF